MKRLFPDSGLDLTDETKVIESDHCPASFQDGIYSFTQPLKKISDKSLDNEFNLLLATDEKSQRLQKLLNALLSIQPTSTSCEQVFSVAGSFKTKIRNRLTPQKLKMLVWLKYYFSSNV